MATPKHQQGPGKPGPARHPGAANDCKGGHAATGGKMDSRITKLEVVLPMLATKADLESLRASLAHSLGDLKTEFGRGQKENRAWMLATVMALFVGLVTLGNFLGHNVEQRLATARVAEGAATMALAEVPPTD